MWRALGVFLLPVLVLVLVPAEWPRWAFMWLLAFAVFSGCKCLAWPRGEVRASCWRRLGYWLAWPGMDAQAFFGSLPIPPKEQSRSREFAWAVGKSLLGGMVIWGILPLLPDIEELQGWVSLVGLALLLHFGLFHVLSCLWRWAGVSAPPLMNRPLEAASVSDFWGKRWNTAFRDLTHRFLFRPLAPWGPRWALLAGFLVSGLVHDLVISVPAGAGYGGPTLFFLVQGGALLVERSRPGKTLGLGRGWRGRLFTMLALVPPAFLLFHPPFFREVMLPFMTALGAL